MANVKHGAKAVVPVDRVEEKARQIDHLLAEVPVLAPDGRPLIHDRGVIEMLATVRCRLDDIDAYISQHGVINPKTGKPHSAALWERRLQSHALKLEKELGLTPLARSKLGLNLARTADLAMAMSNPDPEKRAKQLGELGIETTTEGTDDES